MNRVAVIGGGVAGCAAAVAAAETGARVTLVEAADFLGGVAAQGEHRTLCGLAPIDAAHPDLLEANLTRAWVSALATGPAYRHGRVWLWPTDSRALQAGLARRLAEAGVEVRRGARVVAGAVAGDLAPTLRLDDGVDLPCDRLIDASGGPEVAALLGVRRRSPPSAVPGSAKHLAVSPPSAVPGSAEHQLGPGQSLPSACPGSAEHQPGQGQSLPPQNPGNDATNVNWPAYRGVLAGTLPGGTVARLRAESAAATAAGAPATALVALSPDRWQLSLDLAPGTTLAHAQSALARAAAALGLTVVACARALAARDGGQDDTGLGLAELFATADRGWCWAAWPGEFHRADGVAWTWPPRDRHGIPDAALRAPGSPPWLWTVGKGMPVSRAAAAALRVTGTALALGAAVGAVAGRPAGEAAAPACAARPAAQIAQPGSDGGR